MPWKEKKTMDLKKEFVMKSMNPNLIFKELCKEYGISTKTGYKWKKRFMEDGMGGLKEMSRKPKRTPTKLMEDVICEIIRLKNAHPNWGPKKIRKIYAKKNELTQIPSLSTFNRILDKAGLVTERKTRKKYDYKQLEFEMPPVEKPNDLWTVDFKGWWYTTEQERCEPLTVRDDYSKYILAIKAVESCKIEDVRKEFETLFSIYGLPKAIRSDNGPPFANTKSIFGLTKLSVWWMSLGIKIIRIAPGKPYQNGSHERIHRDIKNEIQKNKVGNIKKHQAVFDEWKEEFNTIRPHEALEMEVPASFYVKSERRYSNEKEVIQYPCDYISRTVNDKGAIRLKQIPIFISNVFYGYNIGIKICDNGPYEVWFDNLLLGYLNLDTFKFTVLDSRTIIR